MSGYAARAGRPRDRLLLTVGLLGAAITVAACSGGSTGKVLATVTTLRATSTTSALPPTSTVVAPTSTAVAPPTTSESTPEAQATAFYQAWTQGDRATAAKLGEPAAVAAVFARTWSPGDGWTFSECSGAAGSAICTWQGPSGQLKMLVRNSTGGLPITVVDVRFA